MRNKSRVEQLCKGKGKSTVHKKFRILKFLVGCYDSLVHIWIRKNCLQVRCFAMIWLKAYRIILKTSNPLQNYSQGS